MTAEHDAVLRLSLVPGLGPVMVEMLIETFGSAVRAASQPASILCEAAGLRPGDLPSLPGALDLDTRDIWSRAERCNSRSVVRRDPEYPDRLGRIIDAPPLIWVRGTLAAPTARLVAVVGTRRATPYGRANARAIAEGLAEAGVGVVSGLALGIDGEAHRGALDAGGWTGAILGCGVDRVYPPSHRTLAQRILQSGAILSELLPGTASKPENFPKRNRIIAGLCSGVVVVEAHQKGGALITARLAIDYSRDVYVVPGPLSSPASVGCHQLVRAGSAALISSVKDIIGDTWSDMAAPTDDDLSPLERRLLAAVPPLAVTLDEVCRASKVDFSDALVNLLDLEFRGFVMQMAGRQFVRTARADRFEPWTGA